MEQRNPIAFLVHRLAVIRGVGWATFKEWAAYRSHMLVSLFTGPVYLLVQVMIWKSLYSTQSMVKGFTLDQMISYFAVMMLFEFLIMDFADWNFQMLIRTGQFLTYLLRPMNHRLFAMSQKVGHRCLGFILEFIPVSLIFFLVIKVRLVPVYPLWFLLSALLGFMIHFFTNYAIGLTAFWLVRAEGLRQFFQTVGNLCSGLMVPLFLFPNGVQKVLFYLPFQFSHYVPVRIFMGSYDYAGTSLPIPVIVGYQALACLIMFLITELLYRLGMKKFTGVGA